MCPPIFRKKNGGWQSVIVSRAPKKLKRKRKLFGNETDGGEYVIFAKKSHFAKQNHSSFGLIKAVIKIDKGIINNPAKNPNVIICPIIARTKTTAPKIRKSNMDFPTKISPNLNIRRESSIDFLRAETVLIISQKSNKPMTEPIKIPRENLYPIIGINKNTKADRIVTYIATLITFLILTILFILKGINYELYKQIKPNN